MSLIDWEKVLANRYNHLLAAEVLLPVAYPLLQPVHTRFPITVVLFLAAIIPSLHVVLPLKAFLSLMSLAVIGFALTTLARFGVIGQRENIALATHVLYALFLLVTIVVLVKRISSQRVVTADTVKGGLSVYFLIGLLYTLVYLIVLRVDPAAYSNIEDPDIDCFYFSFVTLTTLGYGDVVPLSLYAKSLAVLQAFVGQIYLVVFIAQLVGLNLAGRLDTRRDQ